MRRVLKIVIVLGVLGWLADLEWRLRMARAETTGLQRTVSSKLDEHRAEPHAAYFLGQMSTLEPSADLGLVDQFQSGRLGQYGMPIIAHDGKGAALRMTDL